MKRKQPSTPGQSISSSLGLMLAAFQCAQLRRDRSIYRVVERKRAAGRARRK